MAVVVIVAKADHRMELYGEGGGYFFRCDCGWRSENRPSSTGGAHRDAARAHMSERPMVINATLCPSFDDYYRRMRYGAQRRLPPATKPRRH